MQSNQIQFPKVILQGPSGNLAEVDSNGNLLVNGGGGGGGSVTIVSPVDGSGNVKVNLETPIPAGTNAIGSVSVSNFPGTQPVSGTVAVSNFPSSQAVTLPVGQAIELLDSAGTNKASISAAGALKTDGSAVTQPISGTVTANAGTGTFSVSGTVTTTPPSNASTNITQFGGVALSTGTGASGTGIPRVTVSNDSNVLVTPPTLTKGTQGSTGFSTQDLKDAGRVIKVYSANNFTAATTEALITLTPISGGTAGSTGTTFTVTSGKTFRIQAITVSVNAPSTTAIGVVCNLRMTATGAVTATSPLIATIGVGEIGTQVAQTGSGNSAAFPDGIELSGTMQFGISQKGTANAGFSVTLIGYEY